MAIDRLSDDGDEAGGAARKLINSQAAIDSCQQAVCKLAAAFSRARDRKDTVSSRGDSDGQTQPNGAVREETGATGAPTSDSTAAYGITSASTVADEEPNGTEPHRAPAQSDGDGGHLFDVADIIPREGDPRKPPAWLGRGLLQTAVAVTLTMVAWKLWPAVSWVVVDVVIALFIALAIEPVVKRLETTRALNRRGATLVVMLGLTALIGVFVSLFGSMLVQQVTGLVKSLPSAYESLREWANSLPTVDGKPGQLLPSLDDAVKSAAGKAGDVAGETVTGILGPLAGMTVSAASGLASGALSVMVIVITAYYASAYDREARTAISSLIRPAGQARFLRAWEIAQAQVSGFLYSRGVLALVNAVALSVFLVVMRVPYWLPLSIACGLVSQFVPTVGTYLGGALPCLSALASLGWRQAIAVLVFIVVYQQIENLVLSPAVSQATLSLNPAISLLAVMAGGSMAGALGAFLALPIASSVKTVFSQYAVSHEVIPGVRGHSDSGERLK